MGAVQGASEIEGFCAYSPEIARARQLGFIRSFLEWVALHRHAYTIDTAHVLVTGDLISGDIHDDLRVTNAFPAPVQAVRAGMLLAEQVALMAPHFQSVEVHFVSDDNHARLTKKPQAKEAGLNTLNYVVGEVASAYLRELGAVSFHLFPMYETVVHVHGRQYLLSHGHGVQGWAGVPWYGIERKVGKESVARMQIIMQDLQKARSVGFHKYVFGHWHTPFNMPLYVCGGSPMGTDANDHKNGRFARPSQKAWIVHPDHGEFDWIDFLLDEFDPKD
jgi:DNA repair exonuclease SbcCD nuclease subunit